MVEVIQNISELHGLQQSTVSWQLGCIERKENIMAQVFTFEGKTHQFAEDIQPNQEGLYMATLVDQDNVRCEMWFVNGELHRLVELDK